MATNISICNTALGHLGDVAEVSSIAPPDGSVQAALCAKFYTQTVGEVMERHAWGFATRREALVASAETPPSAWIYAYDSPAGKVIANYLAVLDPNATDDVSSPLPTQPMYPLAYSPGRFAYTPQPFAVESSTLTGNALIYSNTPDAVLRYTIANPAEAQISPLCVAAIAWRLASYLAGPIIKGESGAMAAQRCYQAYQTVLQEAIESDANQKKLDSRPSVSWIRNR